VAGLFYGTLIFAAAYLALWPGLGNYPGLLKWTQLGEYEAEVQKAEAKLPARVCRLLEAGYRHRGRQPRRAGHRPEPVLTYCSQCHGSNAAGSKGYPNLTDADWLYGGAPETIRETLVNAVPV